MPKVAKKVLPKTCHCKVCGRALKSPDSVARGIGPTCEQKVLGVVRGASLGKPKRAPDGHDWKKKWLFDELKPKEPQ